MVVERVDGTDLKFKNPGRLLLVVIGFLFWAIGFIDLLGHTSAEPDVFGLYSLPFFIFIIVYGATIIIWFALFFNANLLLKVSDVIEFIQRQLWIAIPAVIGIFVALWVIFEWDRWSRLPGLQFAAFGLAVLALLILLFANWGDSHGKQVWRRVIAYLLIGLLIFEAIIQSMAWFGFLPGTRTIGGNFVPYERIYYNLEGFRNDFANRYGWTYPNNEMEEGKRRILLVGGSFVQALQVEPEAQVGAQLSELINPQKDIEDPSVEVISIGLPGFGLSPFLFEEFLEELKMEPGALIVDEIVVFFHLGDDFQSPDATHNAIMYTIDENGQVTVNPEDAGLRHDLTHYYLRGFLATSPVETIRSNYLTPKVFSAFIRNRSGDVLETENSPQGNNEVSFKRTLGFVTGNYAITEYGHAGIQSTEIKIIPGGNNFIFNASPNSDSKEAVTIADSILETAQKKASENGMKLRLVTIPTFPEKFFNIYQGDEWGPQIDQFNLFVPEEALIQIANEYNIPILPMGQYMFKDQLSVEEINNLFFSNGQGHFSPEGHSYFAEALYWCFFSDSPSNLCMINGQDSEN